jgi:hypothetical protein
MITAKETELPALKELKLSRAAFAAAGTAKGVDAYGKVNDLKEIHTKADEWSGCHEIPASERGP